MGQELYRSKKYTGSFKGWIEVETRGTGTVQDTGSFRGRIEVEKNGTGIVHISIRYWVIQGMDFYTGKGDMNCTIYWVIQGRVLVEK
ncbi:hypothetical protein, partial [Erwinia amylovora]